MLNRFVIAAAAIVMTTPGHGRTHRQRLRPVGPRARQRTAVRLHPAGREPDPVPVGPAPGGKAFAHEPHAQEVRVSSKRDADNAFWARYRNFAAQSERLCR